MRAVCLEWGHVHPTLTSAMKRKMILSGVLLASLFGLQGCGALLVGGGAAAGYTVAKDERTVGQIASDSRITAAINAKFLNEPRIRTWDINVDTHLGVVTLTGRVPDADSRKRAIQAASTTSGVQKVIVKDLRVEAAPR